MNGNDAGAPLLHGEAARDHGLRGILVRTRCWCSTVDCATLLGLLFNDEYKGGGCNDCNTKAELSVAKITRVNALVNRDTGTTMLHYSG